MDNLTKAYRRKAMSAVRSRDTTPEKRVRSIVHRLGFRFRLCDAKLPGKPDIVLPRLKKIVFVHGCFWHGHKGCPASALPKANWRYWKSKIERNIARDRKNTRALKNLGWDVLIVWECTIGSRLKRRLHSFLEKRSK